MHTISSSGEIQGLSPAIKRSLRRVFEHLPKGGSNETLDNLEQECGTYFQFFLRPPLLLDKKSVRPPLTNGQKKVDPPNSKK